MEKFKIKKNKKIKIKNRIFFIKFENCGKIKKFAEKKNNFRIEKMLGITDLKIGQKIKIGGEPLVVVWNQHSKQARGGGVMKTKLKNLISGAVVDRTFQGNEKIEPAEINFRSAQFLYKNGENFEFMDLENFEIISLTVEILGDAKNFLLDGADVDLQYFDNRPINIQLKPKLVFEIIETEPGAKGNTTSNVTKNARIATGLEIKVPIFIEKGEKIILNTETGEYVSRAK